MLKIIIFLLFSSCVFGQNPQSLCDNQNCKCEKDQLTCDKYEGDLDLTRIPQIKGATFIGGNLTYDAGNDHENNLTHIKFYRCDFRRMKPFNLKNFKKLEILTFSQSQLDIKYWDFTGTEISSLEINDCALNSTYIPKLRELFRQATKLKFLSIVGSKFPKIEDELFESLVDLESLELDRCSISNISSLSVFKNLKNFDVNNNELTSLPTNLLENSAHSLINFEIGLNKITTIPFSFDKFKSLSLVEFEDLQLVCNCSWLTTLKLDLVKPKNLLCIERLNETFSEGKNLSDFQMKCHQKKEHSGYGLTVGFIFFVVLAVLIVGALIVLKVLQKRRRSDKPKNSVKYNAVYKDTVEPIAESSPSYLQSARA